MEGDVACADWFGHAVAAMSLNGSNADVFGVEGALGA